MKVLRVVWAIRVLINRHEGRLGLVGPIAVRVIVRKCPKTVFMQSQRNIVGPTVNIIAPHSTIML